MIIKIIESEEIKMENLSCTNCKYGDLRCDEEPCKSCDGKNEWEPESTRNKINDEAYTALVEQFSETVHKYGEMKYREGHFDGYTDCKLEFEQEWKNVYDKAYAYGYKKAQQDMIDCCTRKK